MTYSTHLKLKLTFPHCTGWFTEITIDNKGIYYLQ